ncbi:hypothetical protein C7444_1069 [Sphaerotilus hippei]|uniref:DUF2782 domain-containing protein n=1 Tax=Sphaerotilus hippei TaxID=744406 RepID=A0A318H137_9BURK|nr:hypothetical protein [Sphaerotilus hippei]PXW96492.1 hypothetical protein C7444_1069 [Sphaerotilus hippei]
MKILRTFLTVGLGSTLSAAALAAPPITATPVTREPAVSRTVIDEPTVVVEELRVRGEVQRITVHPKQGDQVLPDYEIVPSTRGRDPGTNAAGSRGVGGQRVWSLLRF